MFKFAPDRKHKINCLFNLTLQSVLKKLIIDENFRDSDSQENIVF